MGPSHAGSTPVLAPAGLGPVMYVALAPVLYWVRTSATCSADSRLAGTDRRFLGLTPCHCGADSMPFIWPMDWQARGVCP